MGVEVGREVEVNQIVGNIHIVIQEPHPAPAIPLSLVGESGTAPVAVLSTHANDVCMMLIHVDRNFNPSGKAENNMAGTL